MLLDDCLPEFDVRTSYAVRIAASPERVYASLRTADFDHWGLTRALSALRALPSFPMAPRETWRRFREGLLRQRFTLKDMLVGGFTLLEERPGEELVLGTVGRFWRSRGELLAVRDSVPRTCVSFRCVLKTCARRARPFHRETMLICFVFFSVVFLRGGTSRHPRQGGALLGASISYPFTAFPTGEAGCILGQNREERMDFPGWIEPDSVNNATAVIAVAAQSHQPLPDKEDTLWHRRQMHSPKKTN